MKVYEVVARAACLEGCRTVFGLLGDANMSLWTALDAEEDLEVIHARHEAGAVAMADGFARASGMVGLATITSGPGLTQIGTSLTCAARNRTPLVVLVGQVAGTDLDNVQRFDQVRFATACEATSMTLSGAANVGREIAEAFYTARVHRTPVVVNLPVDVQAEELEWEFEYQPSSAFAPTGDVVPTSADLELLAEAFCEAERPVIIGGLGVKLAGAASQVARLAEVTGSLLATTLKGKGLFSDQQFDIGIAGAFSSRVTEELLAEADLVLGIGAELGYYTTEGGLLFPQAKVVRMDIAGGPATLGVLPGSYVRSDARVGSVALVQHLSKRGTPARKGYRTEQVLSQLRASGSPVWDHRQDGMDPRALAFSLGRHLPDDAVVTLGAGHFWAFFLMYAPVRSTVDLHFSYSFGAIGQTIPYGMGVMAARRGRANLIIEGDGSVMMNIQELESLTRAGLPAVVLIWNDCGYGAEAHKLKAKGWKPELGTWARSPDFVAVARAFGGEGERLERVEDLPRVLSQGFASKKLFVIDARVSPSVVSDPYQKLQFGVENKAPLVRLD